MRRAARRDANEPELVAAARRIGLKVWPVGELGDWLVQFGSGDALQTVLVEIKTAKGKLSEAQCRRKQAGLNATIVRTVDDVFELKYRLMNNIRLLTDPIAD